LTSLHSKTGLPQLFEIPESLRKLLTKWFEYQGRPGKAAKLVPDVGVCMEREAQALRDDLKAPASSAKGCRPVPTTWRRCASTTCGPPR
jgi:hypothetical protein